jgi:hypothetical protein
MKLFEIKDYNLQVSDEAWGLLPFKAILKKDKNRNKETAFKEMLFIYYYTDIRSDYMYITNDKEREKEIIKDIGLPVEWIIDKIVQEAIDFYKAKSVSVIGKLYQDALKSVGDMSEYLRMTDQLLRERSANGGTVTTLPMITTAQEKLPKIMQNLKAAYKEVLAEQKELEGRTKGSRTMGLFEEGLQFEQ